MRTWRTEANIDKLQMGTWRTEENIFKWEPAGQSCTQGCLGLQDLHQDQQVDPPNCDMYSINIIHISHDQHYHICSTKLSSIHYQHQKNYEAQSTDPDDSDKDMLFCGTCKGRTQRQTQEKSCAKVGNSRGHSMLEPSPGSP